MFVLVGARSENTSEQRWNLSPGVNYNRNFKSELFVRKVPINKNRFTSCVSEGGGTYGIRRKPILPHEVKTCPGMEEVLLLTSTGRPIPVCYC